MNYWQSRNEELKKIQRRFQSDQDYNKELERLHRQAQTEIQKEMDSFLQNYAGRESVSMAEARQQVTKFDVEAFVDKAARYVKERNFSPEANRQLRIYNLKMRMNRLELMNQHIRLETIALANDEERLLTARLDDEAYDEITRQAGILGQTVPTGERLTEITKQIIVADFKGTVFSERIWNDQQALQNELETAIRRVVINGENPRVTARRLRAVLDDTVKNKRYVSERLAITESARVQSQSQKAAYNEYGIRQYEYISEPDACSVCKPLDGQIFNVSEMEAGVNASPMHPHCRCSASSYVDRDAWDADLRSRGL